MLRQLPGLESCMVTERNQLNLDVLLPARPKITQLQLRQQSKFSKTKPCLWGSILLYLCGNLWLKIQNTNGHKEQTAQWSILRQKNRCPIPFHSSSVYEKNGPQRPLWYFTCPTKLIHVVVYKPVPLPAPNEKGVKVIPSLRKL